MGSGSSSSLDTINKCAVSIKMNYEKYAKRDPVKLCVMGGQHEGKSSLANTLRRACCHMAMFVNKEKVGSQFTVECSAPFFNTSPCGVTENTVLTKTWVDRTFSDSYPFVKITDSPALIPANIESQVRALSNGVAIGTARGDYTDCAGQKPDVVVWVVSAKECVRNADQQKAMLQRVSAALRSQSLSFVVALCFKDATEVQRRGVSTVVNEVRSHTQCDSVFPIKNYIVQPNGKLSLDRDLDDTDVPIMQMLQCAFEVTVDMRRAVA